MKVNGLLFLLLLWALPGIAQKSKDVFISGKLLHLNNMTTVFDLSDVGALRLGDFGAQIIPDTSGNFAVHFKLAKTGYFRLGRNILYIAPGDKLHVMIDNNAPEKSEFSGDGSPADNYLRSAPFMNAASYLMQRDSIKTTIQGTLDFVLRSAAKRRELLNSIQGLSAEFKSLEDARIDADIINSLKYFSGFYIRKNKIPKSDQPEIQKTCFELTKPYVQKYAAQLKDPNLLKLDVFRANFYTIFGYQNDAGIKVSEFADWKYAYELFYYIQAAKEKSELPPLKVKIDSVQNPEFREAIKESLNSKSGFWDGDTAIDFMAKDLTDKNISLSSFKGKTIYIDLWASWCVPCLQEIPALDSLRGRYKGNPNIVFISLSIDQNKEEWKRSVQKHQLQGIQLFSGLRALKPYKISTVPRSIIIDREFKVLMMDGPTPSNPALANYLDEVLKKTVSK